MTTAWQGSNRHAELPPNWDRTRQRILARDGGRCTWTEHGVRCGHKATDVDHINPGNDHRDGNLRSLCAYHHRRKTAAEGVAARNGHLRKRPVQGHPGLRGGG